jgi:rod shape-determining protein MreC
VQPGEPLVTSGGDRVFPKGLPIGTVSNVSVGHNLFLDIKVKPAVDLNRLEEVLVITDQKPRAPDAIGLGAIRASDILAGHLPGVPVAPPVPAPQTVSPAAPAAPKPASPSGDHPKPKPAAAVPGTASPSANPPKPKPPASEGTQPQ